MHSTIASYNNRSKIQLKYDERAKNPPDNKVVMLKLIQQYFVAKTIENALDNAI